VKAQLAVENSKSTLFHARNEASNLSVSVMEPAPDVAGAQARYETAVQVEAAASQKVAEQKRLYAEQVELMAQHDVLFAEQEQMRADADTFGLLAKAYGKHGIQARIVEQAIASIEAAANDFLSRFTSGMTVSFVTQRENKTGGTRETLDIMVSDELGTRPIERFSGGERTRVNFALSAGLAAFAQSITSAAAESFIVDEPEYLDRSGMDELAKCLHVMGEQVECVMLVSHMDGIADLLPQRIVVSKDGRGSKVEVRL
jgi:exonuclease SbcC